MWMTRTEEILEGPFSQGNKTLKQKKLTSFVPELPTVNYPTSNRQFSTYCLLFFFLVIVYQFDLRIKLNSTFVHNIFHVTMTFVCICHRFLIQSSKLNRICKILFTFFISFHFYYKFFVRNKPIVWINFFRKNQHKITKSTKIAYLHVFWFEKQKSFLILFIICNILKCHYKFIFYFKSAASQCEQNCFLPEQFTFKT